jgi:CheY-like chemotaxis protein
MPDKEILIVDDEPAIRLSLSQILLSLGYDVRCAANGFSALIEFRQRIPDILLSDLDMPGMSGFELLSVVRRRFPSAHVIAMSGHFSGEAMPAGVSANAFHQKGNSLGSLLQTVRAMAELKREPARRHPQRLMPVWVASNGNTASGEAYAMIVCPECLRAFPQVIHPAGEVFEVTACLHCSVQLKFAVIRRRNRCHLESLPSKGSEWTEEARLGEVADGRAGSAG